MESRGTARIGAICAFAGSMLLVLGTFLHPLGADPNDAVAAFAEYAADRLWIVSHLLQLAGVALLAAALLCLADQLQRGSGSWTRLAAGGAIASLAVAAVLQAVDGIALKAMVNIWAAAPAAQRETAFQAAFAVRQIEIGLAAVASLLLGLTMTVYGVALLVERSFPRWVSWVAIGGGVPTMVAGFMIAYTGFSGPAMATSMVGGSLLVFWVLALGMVMWRRAGLPAI